MLRKRFPAVIAAVAVSGGALLALGAAATASRAHQAARPVTIQLYRGEADGAGNVRLASWGSGRAESSKESVLFGDASIKVTTQGLYQGALLEFANPVDLSEALRNPNTFVRMQVRFVGQGSTQNFFDPTGLESMRAAASPFKEMRYVVTMADGSRYEMIRRVDLPPSEDPESYVPISFPVAAVVKKAGAAGRTQLTGDAARLKSLAIFGDNYQQFYIGEIGIITDETDIVISPLDDQIVFRNDTVRFVADAQAGATSLKYSWDFDASDGIQEDAEGRVVYRVFPKAGKFTVTLTVSDMDGLKKPSKVSQELEVSE